MVYMIESQAHYIVEALKTMKERRLRTIEVKPEAQAQFVGQVQQALTGTVWNSGCKSWYLNDQGRNTAAWPGFTFAYRLKTRRFRLNPYQTERA